MGAFDLNELNNTLERDNYEYVTDLPSEGISEYDITIIKPNPYQPRLNEDVEELKAAINSTYEEICVANRYDGTIRPEDGLLQPITICKDPDGDGYIVVGGHRRLKACLELEHKTIKANLVSINEAQLQSFAIIENLQREDLTPLETALAVDSALKSGNYNSEADLAKVLGKKAPWISKCKSVLKLSQIILTDIQNNKVKIGLEILVDLQRLEDISTQEGLYFKYKKGETKQKDIRDAIQAEKLEKVNLPKTIMKVSPKKTELDFDCTYLSHDLRLEFHGELKEVIKNLKAKYGLLEEIAFSDIKLIEVGSKDVYIEYQDKSNYNISFSKAKKIIEDSIQDKIQIECSVDTKKAVDFINNIPNRSKKIYGDKCYYIRN